VPASSSNTKWIGARDRASLPLLRGIPGASDKPQTDGFGPLLTLGYVDSDALPFCQAHDAGTLERRGVHEDILSALIRSDKAEALNWLSEQAF
jgi:hypothetical protein